MFGKTKITSSGGQLYVPKKIRPKTNMVNVWIDRALGILAIRETDSYVWKNTFKISGKTGFSVKELSKVLDLKPGDIFYYHDEETGITFFSQKELPSREFLRDIFPFMVLFEKKTDRMPPGKAKIKGRKLIISPPISSFVAKKGRADIIMSSTAMKIYPREKGAYKVVKKRSGYVYIELPCGLGEEYGRISKEEFLDFASGCLVLKFGRFKTSYWLKVSGLLKEEEEVRRFPWCIYCLRVLRREGEELIPVKEGVEPIVVCTREMRRGHFDAMCLMCRHQTRSVLVYAKRRG
ncbi:MAG: hypothetical protein DRO11_00135 [Methanobacteriota archaeon]|nr:MAG: hypothetical protein DRO11_00135 [Euryarchaeota archaeon]